MAAQSVSGRKYSNPNDVPAGAAKTVAVAITPDNTATVPGGWVRGLRVAAAGTVNLTFMDNSTLDGYPLIPGDNDIVVKKVRTGGSATNIFGYR